jgi:hypothetical protein
MVFSASCTTTPMQNDQQAFVHGVNPTQWLESFCPYANYPAN